MFSEVVSSDGGYPGTTFLFSTMARTVGLQQVDPEYRSEALPITSWHFII